VSLGGQSCKIWRDEDVRVMEFIVEIDLVRWLHNKCLAVK